MPTNIKCPSCGHQFELNESLKNEVENELRGKMKDWQKKKEEEFEKQALLLVAEAQQKANETTASQLKSLQEEAKLKTKQLQELQVNLLQSHACGLGEEVPAEIVQLMLMLKIKSLSYGHSGVQIDTVKRLLDMYNNQVLPVIYTQGSLGASGDLAPLSHLSLPLIGLGEVVMKEKKFPLQS